MVCPPIQEIIHSLNLVDYLLVQAIILNFGALNANDVIFSQIPARRFQSHQPVLMSHPSSPVHLMSHLNQ